jgi:protein-S-isoprenylcysteine O-methyltransferase Ste14
MKNQFIERFLETLQSQISSSHSLKEKLVALVVGAVVFLLVVPVALAVLAGALTSWIPIPWPGLLETSVAFLGFWGGLFFLGWAILTRFLAGREDAAPLAPYSRLITTGPYQWTRSPIELGLLLYYLGMVTYSANLAAGLLACLLATGVIFWYQRNYEENEMEERFGEAYRQYCEKTPPLFPRLW